MTARIVHTRGVCLHTTPVRESSVLASFLTPDLGRVVVRARGARRPRSRFGASLEILTLDDLVLYRREQVPVVTLSEAAIIEDFPELRVPRRLGLASAAAEFIDQVAPGGTAAQRLYDLLVDALHALCRTEGPRARAGLFGFLLQAGALLGYRPVLDRCLVCRRPVAQGCFSVSRGGVLCAGCAPGRGPTFDVPLADLRALLTRRLGTVPETSPAAEQSTIAFLRYHFERLTLRSLDPAVDLGTS